MKMTTYLAVECTKEQFLENQDLMRWARWYLRDLKAGPEGLWELLSKDTFDIHKIRVVRIDRDPDGVLGIATQPRLGIGIAVCASEGFGSGYSFSAIDLEHRVSDEGAPFLIKSPLKSSAAHYHIVVRKAGK